jgi:zinc/manganese transport system permease protein
MTEFLEMMAAPICCAIVLVAMHGYLGGHVVRRGVIFVDIALAQIAAFGVAVSMWLGAEIGTTQSFAIGLGSSFLGAVLLSFTRSRDKKVPQEAYIGIVYVVFSAAMILVLSQVAHGGEEISNLLVGAILWVSWVDVVKALVLYGLLGLLLRWAHAPLMKISVAAAAAHGEGLSLRRWDFLFYMVLGTVVTLSVQIAGVLMVFTMLVVPTVMSLRLFKTTRVQFTYVMGVGAVAVLLGATASFLLDLPTGAAIVCVFGLLLAVQVSVEAMRRA